MSDRKQKQSSRRGSESLRHLTTKTQSLVYYDTVRDLGLQSADAERADRLREAIETLREMNLQVPVIVEGKRDRTALGKLGLTGTIIALHGGIGIYEFCEGILDRYDQVILLTDWDTKGDELFSTLSGHLKGHWEAFSAPREILRALCQKDTKDIEGIPSLFTRLAGVEYAAAEECDNLDDEHLRKGP